MPLSRFQSYIIGRCTFISLGFKYRDPHARGFCSDLYNQREMCHDLNFMAMCHTGLGVGDIKTLV